MTKNVQRLIALVSQDKSERRKSEEKLVRKLAENVEAAKKEPGVYCPKAAQLLTDLRKFRGATNSYANAEWKIERELALWRFLVLFDKELYAPQLADASLFFARLHYKSTRYVSSEREYEEAATIYDELFETQPARYVKQLFAATRGLVEVYCRTSQFREAERVARAATAYCDKLDSSTRAKYESESRKTLHRVFKKEAQRTLGDARPNQRRLETEARGLKRQARADLRQGRVFSAEAYYKKASEALREQLLSSRSDSTLAALAKILEALGRLRCDERLDKLDEAEQNLEEATNIWRELAESDPGRNVKTASSLATLAYLHERSNRWNVAESEYLEAIAYIRAAQKDGSNRSASTDKLESTTIFRLAGVYARIGRLELAIIRYQEALEKQLRSYATSPDADRAEAALTRFKLASLYKETRRWDDADREYKEALTLYRRLNAEQPEKYGKALASTLNNLAALHSSRKRPIDAENLNVRPDYDETLEIFGDPEKQTSSEAKSALATALQNSAGLRTREGNFEGAEKEYLRSLALRRELALENPVYEDDVARTLNNLARLYGLRKDDAQKIAKAKSLRIEALAIYRRRSASGRSRRLEIARSLYELGELYQDAKDFGQAIVNYRQAELNLREALASRKSNLDELRLELSRVLRKSGAIFQASRQNDEAIEAYKGALAQFGALQTPLSRKIQAKRAGALDALAELYKQTDSTEEELQTRRDAAEAYERLATEEPEKKRGERAVAFFNLAFALQRSDRSEESGRYYVQALSLQRDLASDSDIESRRIVANTLNNLSVVYQQTGQIELAVQNASEALAIYRKLEREQPGKFKSSIAQTLNNLSILRRVQKKFNEAEKAALEALGIRRLELERRPNRKERRARVASALFNLANIYSDENRKEEAKGAYAQASDIYRELAEKSPEYQKAYEKTTELANQI